MNGFPQVPTAESVRQLIAQGEGPTLELKQNVPSVLGLGQLIGSFANAQGGTIIVGVREPNQIVGCNFLTLSQVFERAHGDLSPVPGSYLHQVSIDGVDVGVITVPHSERLVVSSAGAFTRKGTQTRALTPPELQARLTGPATAPDAADIARAIATNTATIDQLRHSLERAQSVRGQLPSYLIGFLLGILASVIASFIYAWITSGAQQH